MAKKTLSHRKFAETQKQHIGKNYRRASEMTAYLEVDEKDWEKISLKEKVSQPQRFLVGDEELAETTSNYIGTLGGINAKTFCKKTTKMLSRMLKHGLRPLYEDDGFVLTVEVIAKMDLKLIASIGSNSVKGDEHHIFVFYAEGYFILQDRNGEELYVAENWGEFEELLAFIPRYFNSKISTGRLKCFNWDKYNANK